MKDLMFSKSMRKFIVSLFSLLFFALCSVSILHASDSERDNNVSFVVVKQVSEDEIKNKLKSAKFKKDHIESSKTDKVNKITNIYYFESAKKGEKKSAKKTLLTKVASSGFCAAIKKAFNAFLNLFRSKSKSENDLIKKELEKIQKQ